MEREQHLLSIQVYTDEETVYTDTIPCDPPDDDPPESDRMPVERVYIPRKSDDGND